jgi:phosphatidylserine/phosphatidylglycerophosphate/cardiolipin synthase-like enzyme
MFKLFRRKSVQGNDLLMSQLFDEVTFYRAFGKDLEDARRSVIIESPYLTEKRALEFSRLFKRLEKRGVAVRLNTRHPRHHDKTLEIQAWKAIKVLRKQGVKVYICSDMRHRKLAIIDNQILWDGSLNIL